MTSTAIVPQFRDLDAPEQNLVLATTEMREAIIDTLRTAKRQTLGYYQLVAQVAHAEPVTEVFSVSLDELVAEGVVARSTNVTLLADPILNAATQLAVDHVRRILGTGGYAAHDGLTRTQIVNLIGADPTALDAALIYLITLGHVDAAAGRFTLAGQRKPR